MSRLAKTAAEHFLSGTRSEVGRDRPDRKVASAFESGRPKIPAHLSKGARREFKRTCRFLEDRRTLSAGDYAAIAVLSEIVVRWIAAKSDLGTNFTITVSVTDKKGAVSTFEKENPLIKIVADCEAKILSYSKALGLTPADRDRVKQLRNGMDDEAVIPGSMASIAPELYVVKPAPKIAPEEMLADDETAEVQP